MEEITIEGNEKTKLESEMEMNTNGNIIQVSLRVTYLPI
jgi:hypothetical protein